MAYEVLSTTMSWEINSIYIRLQVNSSLSHACILHFKCWCENMVMQETIKCQGDWLWSFCIYLLHVKLILKSNRNDNAVKCWWNYSNLFIYPRLSAFPVECRASDSGLTSEWLKIKLTAKTIFMRLIKIEFNQ